jgi:hypothetical protein
VKFRDKQEKYAVLDNDPAGISGTFKIGEIFEEDYAELIKYAR